PRRWRWRPGGRTSRWPTCGRGARPRGRARPPATRTTAARRAARRRETRWPRWRRAEGRTACAPRRAPSARGKGEGPGERTQRLCCLLGDGGSVQRRAGLVDQLVDLGWGGEGNPGFGLVEEVVAELERQPQGSGEPGQGIEKLGQGPREQRADVQGSFDRIGPGLQRRDPIGRGGRRRGSDVEELAGRDLLAHHRIAPERG